MRVLLLLEPGSLRVVTEGLLRPVAEVTVVDSVLDAVEAVATQAFDAVVAPLAAKELVGRVRRLRPNCRVLLLGPEGGRPAVIDEVPDALVSSDVEGLAELPGLLKGQRVQPSLWDLLDKSPQPALLQDESGELRVNAAMRALAGDDPLSLVPSELAGASSLRLRNGERWLDLTLNRHGDQVLGLAAEVTDAEQMSAELSELRVWVHQVAHDLKEPLATLEWHLDEGKTAEARATAIRMRALVRGLLPDRRVALAADCEVVYDEALSNLAALRERTGGTVVRGPLPEVAVQPAECLQLLQNLIGNALKHGGLNVQVSADRVSDSHWELLIQDDGPGIPAALRDRIFSLDPLEGVGMRTCRSIAERRGGSVRVDSEGPGTRVVVRLPAVKEETTQLGHH